jgi:hypothetical protein
MGSTQPHRRQCVTLCQPVLALALTRRACTWVQTRTTAASRSTSKPTSWRICARARIPARTCARSLYLVRSCSCVAQSRTRRRPPLWSASPSRVAPCAATPSSSRRSASNPCVSYPGATCSTLGRPEEASPQLHGAQCSIFWAPKDDPDRAYERGARLVCMHYLFRQTRKHCL